MRNAATIFDANSEVLAHNVPVRNGRGRCHAHLTIAKRSSACWRERLKIPAAELSEKLRGNRRYIVLKREVPDADACDALREKLRAAEPARHLFRARFRRAFIRTARCFATSSVSPISSTAASRAWKRRWKNICMAQDGYRYIEHNRAGQEIVLYRGQERAPRDGYQVHLTVDLNLQNIVENEIDAAMREYHPQKATIILMRPQTGEILAMANRPNFDLNLRADAKPEEMKNRAIIDMMEPGSTFKIVTAAAALNEHKVQPDTTIFCENGVWNYGGASVARSQSATAI